MIRYRRSWDDPGDLLRAAIEQKTLRDADRRARAQRYTNALSNQQRSIGMSRQLSIVVVRPGVYRVSSDRVGPGVVAQVRNLLSRLKKRISIDGTPAPRGRGKALEMIISLLKNKRTVEIVVLN